MKTIASISLGPGSLDCNFRTKFLGQQFKIARIGTDNDPKAAAKLIGDWRDRVDALGLGMVHDHYWVGTNYFHQRDTSRLEKLAGDPPVTTGAPQRTLSRHVDDIGVPRIDDDASDVLGVAQPLVLPGLAAIE